ncbi:MAG: hypothetical protein JKY18_10655, partial [Flavobacteriales bacterium]|nr:hypothetical protein [Flavobacteriales bacterium]
MKNISIALLISILPCSIYAQDWTWVSQTGMGALLMDIDQDENVYIGGSFNDSLTIGTTTLYSTGFTDVYIAKFDSLGNFIWAFTEGGPGKDNDGSGGLTVDDVGNIYIVGDFKDSADFSGTIINSIQGSDIYVAKYDTQGILQWVTQAGGDFDEGAEDVIVDDSGNIYV